MTTKELINRINQQIDCFADNEAMLNRTLSFVSDLVETGITEPSITKKNIAVNIRNSLKSIVPVVCDDMYEYITEKGNVLSISEYISEVFSDVGNDKIKKTIQSNVYYGISYLEKEEREPLAERLYDCINDAIRKNKIRLKESVSNFLREGDFRVIITTFGFPLIEKELELKDYDKVWYDPNRRNDLPFVKDGETKVYHIFGGRNHTSWVYNDQTLLMFVHSLNSGDYGAKNLSNYLRKHGNEEAKRLLVLGSSLPDWLFRFFLYPMYEEELGNVKGYWLSLDEIERGLDFFLDRNNYTGQTNLRQGNRIKSIINEATISISNHKNHEEIVPKIFISYKREEEGTSDYEKVERVKEILERQVNGKVWIDTKKVYDGGNHYWANIKNAIKDCDIFIPLVTEHYLEEYKNSVDIEQMCIKEDIVDAIEDNARDNVSIQSLKPIIREALYAIHYKKKSVPIVIVDDKGKLNGGTTESIIKNQADDRNLPHYIFNELTNLLYDDNNPKFFHFYPNSNIIL